MSGRRRGRWALAVALGTALAFPAASHGVVTIGSNLGRAPTAPTGNNFSAAQEILPAGFQAPGGLTSPVNGVATLWRARTGATGPLSFKVIRPLGGGLFTGAGTTPLVTPAANAISSFPTQLPISIGDRIAISNPASSGELQVARADPSSTVNGFAPALVDGGPGRAPDQQLQFEILINADIEPTSAFEVTKVQKLKKSRLKVTADLPNPGTLTAGDSRDAGIAAAAKKKKKKRNLLQRHTATATAPGEVTVVVKATKAARKKLKQKFQKTGNKKVKIGAKLKLAFTPTGGTVATEVTKTKLKR